MNRFRDKKSHRTFRDELLMARVPGNPVAGCGFREGARPRAPRTGLRREAS
jgi:hypothetical protein